VLAANGSSDTYPGPSADRATAAEIVSVAGADRLRRRFDGGMVLGQLTTAIRNFPGRTRTRAYAANLLNDPETPLCRETRPNWARHHRDEDRLVDLLLRAQRSQLVNLRDAAKLVDYFCAAPGHHGGGIAAGARAGRPPLWRDHAQVPPALRGGARGAADIGSGVPGSVAPATLATSSPQPRRHSR
jgi:hypothetical protein